MNIDFIREELIRYVETNGKTYRWVARRLDINENALTHFKNGKRLLSDIQLRKLHDLINLV